MTESKRECTDGFQKGIPFMRKSTPVAKQQRSSPTPLFVSTQIIEHIPATRLAHSIKQVHSMFIFRESLFAPFTSNAGSGRRRKPWPK